MRNHLVRLLTAALLILAIALPVGADASEPDEGELEAFVTLMRSDAVFPPVATRAIGVASFWHTVGDADAPCESKYGCPRDVHYSIGFGGDSTGTHIHLGEVGENGPIVVNLKDTPRGSFTADDFVGPLESADKEDLIELMRTGGVYVDVHTELFPDGEVRGQIHGPRGRG